MRLLAECNDLLTGVPCERKADCNIVAAKPRRNGCNDECGKDENAQFKGAHMSAERRASPTAAGEAGGAQTQYSNSPRPATGKRGRRLGAGALFGHLFIGHQNNGT